MNMKQWSISRLVSLSVVLLVGSLIFVSGLAMYNMLSVVNAERSYGQTFVPATRLATDFERQVLNARINFIYYVTIQKSGSLEQGTERYHNAELCQQELTSLVNRHEELGILRPGVVKLRDDLDEYSVALHTVVTTVQNGTTSGPVYDAQVKDWAARGGVMVDDAGNVENLAVKVNADSTVAMTEGLKSACKVYACLFSGGMPFLIFLMWKSVSKLNAVLHGSVSEMMEASVQIASAADQIAQTSQSQAQAASEQAAMIEETSSASTEINSMAARTTENSRATATLMAHWEETLGRTNQSLTEMVGAMERINGSSHKISKIIKVIDEISFQTNILALNAAVEAARAGEAGMGFAVVADEVRNLAQRCATAARDTTDLIEGSIQNSDEGRTKVEQVAVAIHAITSETLKVKALIDEISTGSVEQSLGIEQIDRAITQMEQTTQSSAANAEEGAAAAQQLNTQAASMMELVGRLRTMVGGVSGATGELRNGSHLRTLDRNLAHAEM
jgi:hypothetical protein